jgi:hypothetical protein
VGVKLGGWVLLLIPAILATCMVAMGMLGSIAQGIAAEYCAHLILRMYVANNMHSSRVADARLLSSASIGKP